jgi:hypothetical protein
MDDWITAFIVGMIILFAALLGALIWVYVRRGGTLVGMIEAFKCKVLFQGSQQQLAPTPNNTVNKSSGDTDSGKRRVEGEAVAEDMENVELGKVTGVKAPSSVESEEIHGEATARKVKGGKISSVTGVELSDRRS